MRASIPCALLTVASLVAPRAMWGPLPAPTSFAETFGAADTSLEFDARVLDLGVVEPGEEPTAEFRFRNRSGRARPVVVKDADCGCLRIETPEGPVGPGESGTVRARLRTRDRYGFQRVSIRVSTDEPARVPSRLWIVVRIRSAIVPRPPGLHCGRLAAGSSFETEMRLHETEPVRDLRVAAVRGCVARAQVSPRPPGAYALVLRLDAPAEGGPIDGRIVLEFRRCSDDRAGTVEIPVLGSAVSP